MEIADVSAYGLSSPIEPSQERPFHGGVRTLHKRDFVLVVVETTDGERGFAPAGASSSAMREFFEGASQQAFAETIDSEIADALEGLELAEPADVHDVGLDASVSGVVESQALSTIDVALHDIAGKRRGVPVYELLRPDDYEPTTHLPLYASAGMYMAPEGFAEQAALIEECGFFGYKYRPGIGPEGDRKTAELLAEAVDETELMADAHTWWKLEEPYSEEELDDIVAAYAEHDFYWLEEPVSPDDYVGYRTLAEKSGVPLAGGESEESPDGLITLGETGAVDFLQGDVRHHRGFTGCRAAAEWCQVRDVMFVPHNFGTWLGLVANAHLVAATPESELVEYPVFEGDPVLDASGDPGMYPFDLAFDIIEGEPDVADGHLTVPDGPGLGVDVDMDVVEEYPFIEGPWTEFDYDG
ncbi:mandelate racemase/muconate lactonizing enzyme family protein [Halosimplex amylolyticum]|uniref:mandelate racemase/muconate lactonizing enzyme family protein n=1 Tax=Halosimplex amylolyticum TaxID=3396616 RepID=UPI003F569B42